MKLRAYLSSLERGRSKAFASSIGISHQYLVQMASGATNISPARSVAIERATGGLVTRRDLRPHDWHLIWPEMAQESA